MKKKSLLLCISATIFATALGLTYLKNKRAKEKEMEKENYLNLFSKIVIIGGGTAGLSIASKLSNELKLPDITIIEPSEYHFYQPAWTLVGGGAYNPDDTVRAEKNLIPKNVTWIKDSVTEIFPESNYLLTSDKVIKYDYLIVAPGLQLNFNKIKGLDNELGKNGICSIYTLESAKKTWEMFQNFSGGTAIFTFPNTPVKCGGAGQKIMYLFDSYIRKKGLRNISEIIYTSPGNKIFGIEGYRQTIEKVVDKKGITTRFNHTLIEIRPDKKEAVFLLKKKKEVNGSFEFEEVEEVIKYDLLHVVPPMSAPDFIRKSPLAYNEGPNKGWLRVNKFTLQHLDYKNIFGLGDVIGSSSNKTGAAVRKEVPILAHNLSEVIKGNDEDNFIKYDGYTACPVVTDYGKVILAEFDYNSKPKPSFPFDMTKERYSMWLLKVYGLPFLYWNRMLKGKV